VALELQVVPDPAVMATTLLYRLWEVLNLTQPQKEQDLVLDQDLVSPQILHQLKAPEIKEELVI
jgi:hypothetical protein